MSAQPPLTASRGVPIGVGDGQTRLVSTAQRPALGTTGSVLPELAEAPERERKWWKHPAFIVSIITTFLALAGAAAWFVVTLLTDDTVRVTSLTIENTGGNTHLDWEGPDAAYSLFSVQADGEVADLSQWILGGTEAWLPTAAGLSDADTCFVVRPATVSAEVSLDAGALADQHGQRVCMVDAGS